MYWLYSMGLRLPVLSSPEIVDVSHPGDSDYKLKYAMKSGEG